MPLSKSVAAALLRPWSRRAARRLLTVGIDQISANKLDDAIATLIDARSRDQSNAVIHGNLGAAYALSNRYDEAITTFNEALDLDATYWPVLVNFAETLIQTGQAHAALSRFEAAATVSRLPNKVLLAYAKTLIATGDFSSVCAKLRKPAPSLRLEHEYWLLFGVACQFLGLNVQAEAAFRHALRLDSSLPALHARHGRLVSESGQDGSARSVLARDMLSYSASTETAVAYARVLATLEHRATAIRLYRSILADQPRNTEVMINLGNLLKAAPDFDGAERLYRDALTVNSDNPVPLKNLGDILARSFRIEDGISHIRRATEIDVRNPYLLSDLIFAEHYAPPSPDSATPASIRLWQSRFGVAKAPNIHLSGSPKDNPLRIGLLSSNFRRHPVGFLALPVLEALDQTKFSILSYANQIDSDEYTARFRAISDQWKPVSHLSDAELRDLIRGDRIDIHLEMSGHATGHRLPVVAQRVAPVQIKWIGGQYNTMGVNAIDCFLSDPVETPANHEKLHAETVLKLPSSYAGYQAPPYAPDVSALPALTNGWVTFGSLNKINKLNDHTIALWAACKIGSPRAVESTSNV